MSVPRYTITDEDVLFFQHIPKTAGTSLTNILYEQFTPETFYQPTSMGEFFKAPPERLEKVRCLTGHLYYNIDPVIKRNVIYLTILRDPVDRTISEYSQIQRAPEHMAHSVVKAQTLLEYVKDRNNLFRYANLQTRFIGMDFNFFDIIKQKAEAQEKGLQDAEPLVDYSATKYFDPQILKCAQERIEKSAFVGLLENFDDSVELMCDTFGWVAPEKTKILNVGNHRPVDIPQEAIDIIKENTQFDAALYETAKRIFEQRYKEQIAGRSAIEMSTVNNNDPAAYNLRRIEILLKQVDTLSKQVETQQNNKDLITYLTAENARLTQIEKSHAWRIAQRVMNIRHTLIPKGSLIEKLYLKLRNQLA